MGKRKGDEEEEKEGKDRKGERNSKGKRKEEIWGGSEVGRPTESTRKASIH